MNSSYIRADSIAEAVQALEQNKPSGRILAGGTNIVPKTKAARFKNKAAFTFIDIKHIKELKGIRVENGELIIGPTVTLNELSDNELIQKQFPVLAKAAQQIGSLELRNRGTVGGNIGSKSINADLLTPLIALASVVEITDTTGTSEISLGGLLNNSTWHKTGREKLLTAVKVPLQEYTWSYVRWSKESMGRAYVIALAGLKLLEGSQDYYYKIVIGGAGVRPRQIEGKAPKRVLLEKEAGILFASKIVEQVADKKDRQDSYWFQLTAAILGAMVHTGR